MSAPLPPRQPQGLKHLPAWSRLGFLCPGFAPRRLAGKGEQLVVLLVNPLLDVGDILLGQVAEPALDGEVLAHRLRLRDLPGDHILPVDHFIKREDLRLDRKPRCRQGLLRVAPPARRAGGVDVEVGRTLDERCLLRLVHEVEIVVRVARGHIGSAMSYGDGRHVLLPRALADALLSRRRGRGRGAVGGRARPLDAGIHVGLVIEAEVDEVVPALEGPGQGLHADIRGRAVTAHADKGDLLLRDLPLPHEGLVARLDPRDDRRGVLEGDMEPRHPPGALGEG